jgi:hypothetical protein
VDAGRGDLGKRESPSSREGEIFEYEQRARAWRISLPAGGQSFFFSSMGARSSGTSTQFLRTAQCTSYRVQVGPYMKYAGPGRFAHVAYTHTKIAYYFSYI